MVTGIQLGICYGEVMETGLSSRNLAVLAPISDQPAKYGDKGLILFAHWSWRSLVGGDLKPSPPSTLTHVNKAGALMPIKRPEAPHPVPVKPQQKCVFLICRTNKGELLLPPISDPGSTPGLSHCVVVNIWGLPQSQQESKSSLSLHLQKCNRRDCIQYSCNLV